MAEDPFTSLLIDDRVLILKHEDTFAVFDRFGDIESLGEAGLGVYHCDTRFLSRLDLKLGEDRPLFLSSSITDDNAIFTVNLVNPDLMRDGAVAIPGGTVRIHRSKVLLDATLGGWRRLPAPASVSRGYKFFHCRINWSSRSLFARVPEGTNNSQTENGRRARRPRLDQA